MCRAPHPQIDEVLIPEVRRQRYGALDPGALVRVLDRYRELAWARPGVVVGEAGAGGAAAGGGAAAVVGPKERTGHVAKRAVDAVARQLRAQMVAGGGGVAGRRVLEDV